MSKRIRVVQMFYTFDVEVGGGGLSLFAIELGRRLDPELFDVSLCSLGYSDSKLGQKRMAQLKAEGIRARHNAWATGQAETEGCAEIHVLGRGRCASELPRAGHVRVARVLQEVVQIFLR